MAWLTEEEFTNLYLTDGTNLPQAQIAQCLSSAINKVRFLVGEAAVSEVGYAIEPYEGKVADLREVQELLAYRKLLFFLSARFRDGGIVVRERDENAVTTNEYASIEDVEKRREALLNEALSLVEPYLVDDAETSVKPRAVSSLNVTIDQW